MTILLVRPTFKESRNSVFRIPVGLAKLATWYKARGDEVIYQEGQYVDGEIDYESISIVHITTMFTYWSGTVIDAINFYKKMCPNAKIIAGGIYASIAPEHLTENSMVDEVMVGVHPEADRLPPDYSILPRDNEKINNTQIVWASRGCARRCHWCFVHVIEPNIEFIEPDDVYNMLALNPDRKNVLFYDNSILQHPKIDELLDVLIKAHKDFGFKYNATQGIDGRMMKRWEEKGIPIAKKMKKAGFYDLRFSYDHIKEKESVYYCVEKFAEAKFAKKDMQVFVIINNEESPEVIEDRYWEIYSGIGTQIHSDRFRPADWYFDHYDGSKKPQTGEEYFINEKTGWNDLNIKGTLRFMSDLNYATRMGCLYTVVKDMQRGRELNKGKSSVNLDAFMT